MDTYGYSRYSELRCELEFLRDEFTRLSGIHAGPYSQLLDSPTLCQPLSASEWDAFIKANKGKQLQQDGEWEEWDVFPDGTTCCRFHGLDGKQGIADFLRLAQCGYDLIYALGQLNPSGFGVPDNFTVQLPDPNKCGHWCPLDRHYAWLDLIYETGRVCSTTFLNVDLEFWMYGDLTAKVQRTTRPANWEESLNAEASVADEIAAHMTTPDDGGPAFPSYPFTRTLRHDLFRSSADAISAWLDSPNLVVISLRGDIPISLPSLPVDGFLEVVDDEATVDVLPAHEGANPAKTPVSLGQLKSVVPDTGIETAMRPRWDQERRQLWVGDCLIKHFKVPAKNQESILAAFHEEGWPARIDDPLSGGLNKEGEPITPKQRLNDTITALNQSHKTPDILRFEGDGTGEGVVWTLEKRR